MTMKKQSVKYGTIAGIGIALPVVFRGNPDRKTGRPPADGGSDRALPTPDDSTSVPTTPLRKGGAK